MTASNVHIKHWRAGRLIQEIHEHNVLAYYGRQMLADIIGENPPNAAPTPVRDERVKYLGLGVGGRYRNALATQSPLVDSYPPGSAEHRVLQDNLFIGYTSGNQYNQNTPYDPLLATLELPVRVTGSEDAYPGQPLDTWLVGAPNLYCTHLSSQELTVHAKVDASAGDYVYGSFTSVPITEAGLFTNTSSPTGDPYQQLLAYVGFDTLLLTPTSTVEFVWRVRFA
jgi:hypothetical protein